MTAPSTPSTLDSAHSLADDLAFAHTLADAADQISAARFTARDLEISTKPDRSYVTDADLAVERAIRDLLAERRPDDGILGEEYGTEGTSSRQWIIDPIDGTANFLRGVPNWATLISLAVDGVPQLGVVSAPGFQQRWWAATGLGAWTRRTGEDGARRLGVSAVDNIADASLSFQSIEQWDQVGRLAQLTELSRTVWRDRAYGDMWSYMLLAEGVLDAVAEFDVKEYDLAALVPIVREAGGRFTDIDGVETIATRSSLASNGLLHGQLLGVVSAG
ncbi:histidinol phosphatase [Mycetocola reblochoni]|uniref:Histidinol-phosphatase n=2 Tax=Mycetocola reblochoni TaxID=331618 RepID=A0A1R4JA77_9MICO|nr:inositol monophosphatase family protein [Mycetocola reblochoni]RLP70048.1 histidinol phosphatase [Mycetocola reblochoni]SJN28946.1 Histidinol-phosphatase [alternative form] [Mycetocola reblochoni REB411]